MRSLIFFFLVCCSFGCTTHTLTSHAPVTLEQFETTRQPTHLPNTRMSEKRVLKILGVSKIFPWSGPAKLEQIETAKQRMHLLHAGMTERQVFYALGLSNCYGHCFNIYIGGWATYGLTEHHSLSIRRGSVGLSQWFVSAVSIDDVNWKRDEKE